MSSRTAAVRLTIGELSEATGMTVRNIRNHQSRGLLPPPELEARTGYYGEQHVERLRLIQAMQADGFNLAAIQRLLSGSELRRAATVPLEAPAVLSEDDLVARFGPLDRAALAEAERLGLLVRLDDGHFEAPRPALLRAAEEAVGRGVGLAAALRAVEHVKASCEAIAEVFVGLFTEELWRPDMDESEAVAAVEGLRPVAVQTVMALFDQAMADEAGRAIER
jgi:DNA-binding transcriptional MerR regulator